MMNRDNRPVSRRIALKAVGGAAGLLTVGSVRGHEDDSSSGTGECPEATTHPSMVHYEESWMSDCADDHPETQALHADVQASLEERFPTVGSLVEAGFVPYFDFFAAEGERAWSHWLNPAFLENDTILDPATPESVLVDHKWWRPIGFMFIATMDGDRVDPPPTVYTESDDGEESAGNDSGCMPWHAHVGLPGRYSWWKFQAVYKKNDTKQYDGLPCRTPWMMHMWGYPHEDSLYAHGAPARGNRGGGPAEPAGFETDAQPGEDPLGPDILPDALRHRFEQLY